MNLQEIKTKIDELRGTRNRIVKEREEAETTAIHYSREIEFTEVAQGIIQKVAEQTQQQLEYHVSELVTLAQAAIFSYPYKFITEFTTTKGRGSECRFYFEDPMNDNRISPLAASGGGPVDVASWGLRTSILTLKKTRLTMWLDEPFKFLSADLQPRAGEILKEVSEKLGIQFVMITHIKPLMEAADRVFEVTKGDGVSQVEVINNDK